MSKQVLQLAKDPNRHEPKSDAYQLPDAYEDEQGRIDTRRREDLLTARYGNVQCCEQVWPITKRYETSKNDGPLRNGPVFPLTGIICANQYT